MADLPEGAAVGVAVRPAAIDDLDDLVAIHSRSSQRAYAHIFPPAAPVPSFDAMADRWRPSLTDGDTVVAFVAEIDGRTVGGVIVDSAPETRGFGNLRHLYVEPATWGNGAGRALHDAAVGWCNDAGLDSMELWVLEQNERARRMYERWGWTLDPDERLVHDGLDVTEVRYVLRPLPRTS
jgi:GNAT superfamily N-acetyltransferase